MVAEKMAVIIKNAGVNVKQAKKLDYSIISDNKKSSKNTVLDWITPSNTEGLDSVGVRYYNELIQQSETDDIGGNELSSPDNANSSVELIDRGIKYQGVDYIHPAEIDELVKKDLSLKVHEMEVMINEEKEIGYQDGYKEGIAKAEKDYDDKFQELTKLITSIDSAFEIKVKKFETFLTSAIFAAVARVLGDAVINDEDRISMVKNVVKTLKSTKPYVLRVSEYDYKIITGNNAEVRQFNTANIIADNRVELGGCIIETDKGIFDGRLEVQLARLKDVIDSKVV